MQSTDTRVAVRTERHGLGSSCSCKLVAPGQGWREADLGKQDVGVLWSSFHGTDLPYALFLSGALGCFPSTVKAVSAGFQQTRWLPAPLCGWGFGGHSCIYCAVIFLTSCDFMLEVFYCL